MGSTGLQQAGWGVFSLGVVLALASPRPSLASEDLLPQPPGDYVVGVEDRLTVSVWREAELQRSVVVRPDGKITIPLVGDVVAAGKTPGQLASELQAVLAKYIRDPVVTVIVEEINHFKVFVLGQVNQQGMLLLKRPTRLLQALALAGGLTEFADKSQVTVIRQEDGRERRLEINVRKVFNGERPDQNIYLKPGDTIIVD